MVSFFKDKSAVSVFWLVILCFGLHVYSLINPPQLTAATDEGFFYYLMRPFANLQPYTLAMLYVFIIFLEALQLNFIIDDLRMLPRQSYTPAAAFLLLSSLLPAFNQITPALLACNLLIWIIYSSCRLYNAPKPKTSIYNLGLLTGICVILYYPALPLAAIALLAVAIMRPFRLNEWFVLIFGLLTPLYFLVTWLFLKDDLQILPLPQQLFSVSFSALQLPVTGITLAVAACITISGIISAQRAGNRELIQVRKGWNLILIFLIFCLPGIVFIRHAWPAAVLLALVPAACFTGHRLGNMSRNILPVIFFWMLVALSIYNNWFAKY